MSVIRASAYGTIQLTSRKYGFNTGDPAFLKKAAEVIFGKDSEVLKAEKVNTAHFPLILFLSGLSVF